MFTEYLVQWHTCPKPNYSTSIRSISQVKCGNVFKHELLISVAKMCYVCNHLLLAGLTWNGRDLGWLQKFWMFAFLSWTVPCLHVPSTPNLEFISKAPSFFSQHWSETLTHMNKRSARSTCWFTVFVAKVIAHRKSGNQQTYNNSYTLHSHTVLTLDICHVSQD